MRKLVVIILLTIFGVNFQSFAYADEADFGINEKQPVNEFTEDGLPDFGTVETPDPFNKIDPTRPIITSQTKCLGRNKNGYGVKRYLYIQYPWRKFQNASIEIRIVGPEAKKQPKFCKPIQFMTTIAQIPIIKRDLAKKSFRLSGYVDNIEYDKSVLSNEGFPKYELILASIQNLVGNEGLFFHARVVNPETNELETTLIFPELKNWAVNDDILALELRGKLFEFDKSKREYEQPCELKIWFLKDNFVVWEENVLWPGTIKEATAKKTKESVNKNVPDEDPQAEARRLEEQEKQKDEKKGIPQEEKVDSDEDVDAGAEADESALQ